MLVSPMATCMPASNPQEAANEYESNTDGDKWNREVQRAIQNNDYAEGVADFLGVNEGQVAAVAGDWESNVSGKQERYENKTDGKGQKWARKYSSAMTASQQ